MKKIPCVFVRDFSDKRNPKITDTVTPGCEWVLAGEGVATRKYDGTACLVRDGKLYKRYDAKKGKPAPEGWEAIGEADPVTGHWPGWMPVNEESPDPADVWHALVWWQTLATKRVETLDNGTYELVGPKINANREEFILHSFVRHGNDVIGSLTESGGTRSFGLLLGFLSAADIEGIVFWREPGNVNGDMAKLTRENFGFPWPVR